MKNIIKNFGKAIFSMKTVASYISVSLIFAFPMSTSYQLKSFEFGSGGDAAMGSANYSLEGLAGEVATDRQSSTSYGANSGLEFVQMANTPSGPTLTNDSNWYDKLKIIIGTSNNPSDTGFAVAISVDNFSTTNYIQSDGTIGSILGPEDFLSYSAWGGASGSLIIGLDPGTTYYVKSKARQGAFTEGPFGPVVSASTVNPSISMDIDISAIDEETTGPYIIDFGDLSVGSVSNTVEKIWVDFETNAYGGGAVYVRGQNAGLVSTTTSYTIPSLTADLGVSALGYGLRGLTSAQSSGGPFSIIAPYDGTNDNVGVLGTDYQELFRTSLPLVAGRGSGILKSKITDAVPAADDYSDLLTVIVAASF